MQIKIKKFHQASRLCTATLFTMLASGCTTLGDFFGPLTPANRPVVAVDSRPRLEPIDANEFLLETPEQSVVGEPQIVFTEANNTFSDLAREYGLGYDELVEANPGVDPWLPGENTPVLLPTQYILPDAPRQGIVLNIASKRLFYFPETADGEMAKVITYPIGIGRVGWETPLGASSVIAKARDPHWWVPASVRKEHEELGDPLPAVVPPGPDNPLGKYVLKLDLPGYLIHGTNQPYGVGMRVSHGCVRLYPENIEALYPQIALGVPVTIVNQPMLAGWHRGELFIESHAPLEDDEVEPETHLQNLFASLDIAQVPSAQSAIRAVVDNALGVPLRPTRYDSAEILQRARVVVNTVEPDPDMPTLAEVRELLDAPLDDEGAVEQ